MWHGLLQVRVPDPNEQVWILVKDVCFVCLFCLLIFSSSALKATLELSLGIGGPDGAYSLGHTYEGDHGFSDLSKYHVPGDAHYIGTTYHETYKAK